MAVCQNCGLALSCGCKVRISKSGKSCCTKCVAAEDAKVTPKVIPSRPIRIPAIKHITASGPA